MKSILRFSTVLALAALVGCSQNQQPTAPEAADLSQEAAALSLEKSLPKITVPDDYATIQAAVDAATPGTKIKVKAGTYVESPVTVDVAGVRITAEGAVTLQGSFIVSANNVQIDHFTIVNSASAAILVGAVSGVEIVENEISSGSSLSNNIVLDGSTDCTVKDNESRGANFGVFLSGANGNTIDGNACTGNGDGIRLNSSADNEISGNNCSGNAGDGIELGSSNDNQLKDNTCNDNGDNGIELSASGGNTIGSKNTANGNRNFGIRLTNSTGNSNNVVKKNTCLNNGDCDIVDENPTTTNTFIKNKAGCTSGF